MTNGDILDWGISNYYILKDCAADKKALIDLLGGDAVGQDDT